jgi:restriction system protein
MSRNQSGIFDFAHGVAIWCGLVGAYALILGAYRVAGSAALIAVTSVAIAHAVRRYSQWRTDQERCPHGVPGGFHLERCADCIADKKHKEEATLRKIAEQARQALIGADADRLRVSERTRLVKSIVPTLDELRHLSPQRFEDEMASLFARLGYKVQQTPYTNDFGRDAILEKNEEKYLLECKRYGEGNVIGRPQLQKFHSAIISDKAVGGYFVTTGTFTAGAKTHAPKLGVTLVDGDELLRYLARSKIPSLSDDSYLSMCKSCGTKVTHSLRLPNAVSCSSGHPVEPTIKIDDLIGHASAPDAPLCKRCGKPMKLVKSKRGKRFWGCSQWPKCKSYQPWVAGAA